MQIQETFRRASLQREVALGLKDQNLTRYQEIQSAYDERRAEESVAYRNEYGTRVEAARKRLVDDAASKGRSLRPRFLGRDGFNKEEINRLAHRTVRLDHLRTLEGIETARQDQTQAFLTEVGQTRELGEKMKDNFARATDRRVGPDRRSSRSR